MFSISSNVKFPLSNSKFEINTEITQDNPEFFPNDSTCLSMHKNRHCYFLLVISDYFYYKRTDGQNKHFQDFLHL